MKIVCEFCKGKGKDAVGNPCRECLKRAIDTPDLKKHYTDFDLKK